MEIMTQYTVAKLGSMLERFSKGQLMHWSAV